MKRTVGPSHLLVALVLVGTAALGGLTVHQYRTVTREADAVGRAHADLDARHDRMIEVERALGGAHRQRADQAEAAADRWFSYIMRLQAEADARNQAVIRGLAAYLEAEGADDDAATRAARRRRLAAALAGVDPVTPGVHATLRGQAAYDLLGDWAAAHDRAVGQAAAAAFGGPALAAAR